jgi:hypothetical protein
MPGSSLLHGCSWEAWRFNLVPSPAAVARDARWRERQLQTIPADQRARWIEDRDTEDANHQAYLRIFGVLMGGFGFAAALREAAYLTGKYGR